MHSKKWVTVSAVTSTMILPLSFSQVVAKENRPHINTQVGEQTVSLPVLSVLEKRSDRISGAVVVPRKAGESEAEYQERFNGLVGSASTATATEIQPLTALTYYMYTNWGSSACRFKHADSSSWAKTGSSYTAIDYIRAKTRLYSGGDLIASKTDAHEDSSIASASVDAQHWSCRGGAWGTHEFREAGYETLIDETIDGNPF